MTNRRQFLGKTTAVATTTFSIGAINADAAPPDSTTAPDGPTMLIQPREPLSYHEMVRLKLELERFTAHPQKIMALPAEMTIWQKVNGKWEKLTDSGAGLAKEPVRWVGEGAMATNEAREALA